MIDVPDPPPEALIRITRGREAVRLSWTELRPVFRDTFTGPGWVVAATMALLAAGGAVLLLRLDFPWLWIIFEAVLFGAILGYGVWRFLRHGIEVVDLAIGPEALERSVRRPGGARRLVERQVAEGVVVAEDSTRSARVSVVSRGRRVRIGRFCTAQDAEYLAAVLRRWLEAPPAAPSGNNA